ncbi:unannotated protein [freshwater metagenome]|uniref:Unannotated protein n=1 Tax=freshwater metagenome TaxID=449393 RepID=A0A6J7RB58_9ZZZZ
MQAQAHCRDDAEGALRAAEERREVVAGVVLEQALEVGDHRAIGQHRLDAGELGAGHAVGDDVDSTGVRRDGAADRRRVARGEVDPVHPAGRGGVALHVAEEGAGAGRELAGELIDLADVREPAQGDDDGQAHGAGVSGRDSAADEAGVAALRQDRDVRYGAGSDNPGDLGGRAGPYDCKARTGEPAGPVGGVRSDEFGR